MIHCMYDLETLGTGSHAAILTIGAVKFDPMKDDSDLTLAANQFHCRLDLTSVLKQGGEIDAETVLFWLRQDKDAQNALFDPYLPMFTLRQALHELRQWYPIGGRPTYVWADSSFDHTIMSNMYRINGQEPPWNFREAYDYRTMRGLFGLHGLPKYAEKQHDALADAIHQAKVMKRVLSDLEKKGVLNG